MSRQEEARRFREAFGQEICSNFSSYGIVRKDLWALQLKLIREEIEELLEAADELYADPENNNRREEFLKELADSVFVHYQLAAAFSFDLDETLRRVYESNMSKLDEHGKPIYRADGKVLKGPNYQPPSLDGLYPQANTHYDTHGK